MQFKTYSLLRLLLRSNVILPNSIPIFISFWRLDRLGEGLLLRIWWKGMMVILAVDAKNVG